MRMGAGRPKYENLERKEEGKEREEEMWQEEKAKEWKVEVSKG